MKTFVFIIISLLLVQTPYSQNDSSYILPRLKIYQKEKSDVVYYRFEEYNYNRFVLSDSFLTADARRYNYKVRINDIDHISFQSGRDFWGGAIVLGAVGYTLGFLFTGFGGPFGWAEEPYFRIGPAIFGGLIGAVPFGLLGGLIGLLAPAYDDYNISKLPDNYKINYLKKVFRKKGIKF